MVLFTYATTHLLNHKLRNFLLEIDSYVKENYFRRIWKSQVGTFLLYDSFLIHVPLGLISILNRKSIKITLREWLQIVFIILALFVFVQHVSSMYLLTRTFNAELPYEALSSLVLFDPSKTASSTTF